MDFILLTYRKDGSVIVRSEKNPEGMESKFNKITDEKQKALIALAAFLGYDTFELLGHAFAGEPGWEE